MSEQNLALDYAKSVADGIWEDTRAGHPFGLDTDMSDSADGVMSAYDYLAGVLDIEYTFDYERKFLSAVITISFGGPNAYIDTKWGMLDVYWNGHASRSLPDAFVDELHEACRELAGA